MDNRLNTNEFDIRDIEIYMYRCEHALRQLNSTQDIIKEFQRNELIEHATEVKKELDKEIVTETDVFRLEFLLLMKQRHQLNIMGHIAQRMLNPEGFIGSNLCDTFNHWTALMHGGYDTMPGDTHPIKFSAADSDFFKIFMIEDLHIVQNHRFSDVYDYRPSDDDIEHLVRSLSLSNSSTGSFDNDEFLPMDKGAFVEFHEYYDENRIEEENDGADNPNI